MIICVSLFPRASRRKRHDAHRKIDKQRIRSKQDLAAAPQINTRLPAILDGKNSHDIYKDRGKDVESAPWFKVFGCEKQ